MADSDEDKPRYTLEAADLIFKAADQGYVMTGIEGIAAIVRDDPDAYFESKLTRRAGRLIASVSLEACLTPGRIDELEDVLKGGLGALCEPAIAAVKQDETEEIVYFPDYATFRRDDRAVFTVRKALASLSPARREALLREFRDGPTAS